MRELTKKQATEFAKMLSDLGKAKQKALKKAGAAKPDYKKARQAALAVPGLSPALRRCCKKVYEMDAYLTALSPWVDWATYWIIYLRGPVSGDDPPTVPPYPPAGS